MKTIIPVIFILVLCSVNVFTQSSTDESLNKAILLFQQKDYQTAYPILEQILEQDQTIYQAYLYKGLIERHRKMLSQAENSFRQGLSIKEDELFLRLELAVTLSWENKLSKSLEQYKIAGKYHKTNLPAKLGEARILSWLGKYKESKKLYNEIIEESQTTKDEQATKYRNEALNGLAFIEKLNLKKSNAKKIYEDVLNDNPDNIQALEGLESLDEIKRWELQFSTGFVLHQSRPKALDVAFLGRYKLTNGTQLTFGYEYKNADRYLESLLTYSNDELSSNSRISHFGIKQRITRKVDSAFSISQRSNSNGQKDTVIENETAYKFNDKINISIGNNFRFSKQEKTNYLTFGILNYSPTVKTLITAQYFNGGSLGEKRSNAVAANISRKVHSRIKLQFGSGIGFVNGRNFQTGYAGFELKLNRDLDLNMRYTQFRDTRKQEGIISTINYRF